jgi:hypothetical protein
MREEHAAEEAGGSPLASGPVSADPQT